MQGTVLILAYSGQERRKVRCQLGMYHPIAAARLPEVENAGIYVSYIKNKWDRRGGSAPGDCVWKNHKAKIYFQMEILYLDADRFVFTGSSEPFSL